MFLLLFTYVLTKTIGIYPYLNFIEIALVQTECKVQADVADVLQPLGEGGKRFFFIYFEVAVCVELIHIFIPDVQTDTEDVFVSDRDFPPETAIDPYTG